MGGGGVDWGEVGAEGFKSILHGHNPRPEFCIVQHIRLNNTSHETASFAYFLGFFFVTSTQDRKQSVRAYTILVSSCMHFPSVLGPLKNNNTFLVALPTAATMF